jgi:DNA-binding transcriptional LysR family regulator
MTPLPFDLSQLRCFVVLCETLHFGKAAARLHMTQPPLSRQIALLEERLGVRLLDRDSRSVRMTPAGRYFVNEARAILQRAEDSAIETRLAAEGLLGTLAIGFTASASYEILPRLVGLHHARYPGIGFVFKEMLIEEQLRLLGTGSLDIAIVRPPVDMQRFDFRIVMKDHWAVALPAGHPLCAADSVSIRQLHERPFIAWSPIARYFHLILERLLGESDVRPRTVVSMSQPPAILAMVRAGLGLAVVPNAMASQGFGGVALRRLDAPGLNPAILALESVIAWRRGSQEATLQRLIETVSALDVGSGEKSPAPAAALPSTA